MKIKKIVKFKSDKLAIEIDLTNIKIHTQTLTYSITESQKKKNLIFFPAWLAGVCGHHYYSSGIL